MEKLSDNFALGVWYVRGVPVRSVEWRDDAVVVLDQTTLPTRVEYHRITTVDGLIDAVRRLAVRGAPALGVCGAFGVVLAMDEAGREDWERPRLEAALDRLRDCRPTAVNLGWAVETMRSLVDDGRDAVLTAARQLADDDEAANRRLSALGADWLVARLGQRRLRVLTHCNTGALATSAWGTALGVIRELAGRDLIDIVYADETRPLLQGARLTAWELADLGIEHVVQADAAAASTIVRGLVDVAIVGADRIARNGDTANKIGTLGVALACADAGAPFLVAAPWSTVDLSTPHGDAIVVEHRDPGEVEEFAGHRVAPTATRGFNPAFDVTPSRLITAIATERGVLEPVRVPDLGQVR